MNKDKLDQLEKAHDYYSKANQLWDALEIVNDYSKEVIGERIDTFKAQAMINFANAHKTIASLVFELWREEKGSHPHWTEDKQGRFFKAILLGHNVTREIHNDRLFLGFVTDGQRWFADVDVMANDFYDDFDDFYKSVIEGNEEKFEIRA